MSAMTFGQKSFTPTPPDKGSFALDHEGECKSFMLKSKREMLRSLYAYKGTHARTLAFSPNEKFLEIGISKDPNWVHVITENGNLGYVPKNYVALDQVPPIEMLELIDACIEGIHLTASERGGNYLRLEHEALQALVEKRQEWHNKVPPAMHPSKRPAPPPPNRTTSQLSVDSVGSSVSDGSLPSPSTPTPIATPAPTPTITPNSAVDTTPFPDPVGVIRSPKRRSSEIETSTSFIGRGDSFAEEEESNGCDNEEHSLRDPDEWKKPPPSTIEENCKPSHATLSLDVGEMQKLIPQGYCRQLVEEIRSVTNISFSTSQQVVTLVLRSLGATLPSLSPLLDEIFRENRKEPQREGPSQLPRWESSGDGRKLVDLLEKLRQCKDDEQQRSWALHEDEFAIKEHLDSLLDVLMNGDVEACNQVLMLEDYRPLLTLVQYYQMETRWNLRKLLLQIFTIVCQMSQKNISYLSSSVLPLELTREILDAKTTEEELQYIVLVLGMILSMADTLPFTHFSIMNESFVNDVLNGIEMYNRNPDTEGLAELYMTLLLAFNLQYHTRFCDPNTQNSSPCRAGTENLVIKALSLQRDTKYFIEKILILFNREEDPVRMFDHDPQPPHSVLSIIGDMFSCPETAQLLYTNDEKVLCDIILRQLTDLAPEDKRRRQYLCLLEGVVTLGRWKEYQHRREEFSSRLKSILSQEEFPWDKNVAGRILNIFSNLKTTYE